MILLLLVFIIIFIIIIIVEWFSICLESLIEKSFVKCLSMSLKIKEENDCIYFVKKKQIRKVV